MDNPDLGSSFARVVKRGGGSSFGSKGQVERLNMVQEVIIPVHMRELRSASVRNDLVCRHNSPPKGDEMFVDCAVERKRS